MSQRTTNLENGTPSLEEVEDPGVYEDETIDKVEYEELDGLEDDECDEMTVWKEDGCTETISMIKLRPRNKRLQPDVLREGVRLFSIEQPPSEEAEEQCLMWGEWLVMWGTDGTEKLPYIHM
ncbi:hypothetical protein EDD18DRAFT_1110972 [Armillaria luteobubalina]|uniref:Uncharacterized protein n=1 Tax=Armillaria luteobubalina TaxID=153913 RepID=A0AA39PLX3_9AGAR|nr:hypothetical protein EDD18DRAFT_1110972 [Armillaria luteobubalina]